MCKFFSGVIVNKNKTVLWDFDEDSHSSLLEKHGIKDESESPNFVRVELLPSDGDIWNHDLSQWTLHVDQDFKPDWFSVEKSEKLMRKALKRLIDERFIINKRIEEIKSGRWFIGNGGTINDVRGGTINAVRGGTIKKQSGENSIIVDREKKIIMVSNPKFKLKLVK